MSDVKIRISDGVTEREITRRRIPPVGSYVKEGNRRWLVISVEQPLRHRVPGELFAA
jgi:hypothetical protein